MREKFIKATSGWIPGIVMLLFAAALVYGRPADELAADVRSSGPLPVRVDVILDAGLELPLEGVRIGLSNAVGGKPK